MTLALLITAATGAWAEDLSETITTTTQNKYTYTGEHFKIECGVCTGDGCWLGYVGNYSVTITPLADEKITKVEMVVGKVSGTIVSSTGTISGSNSVGSTLTLNDVDATTITLSRSGGGKYDYAALKSFTIYYEKPLATLAADGLSATMTMPASDVTVTYELVRDMQDEANPVAFSGLPSSGNIVVKKGDDGKYQPAEALTIQLIDPLAAAEAQNIIAADGITVKVLVGAENGQGAIDYDQDNPITLEAFLADMTPGYYWIKAEPTDENSPYDGTVYSSQFTVVEQYDLTVKPANDFSKGKIDAVTVGSETVTPDATTGKVTKTGIAPDTEVKLKAKRGYVIEKVEVKKTVIPMLNAATTENIGMVVCNKGHLHDAKTAVPDGCTAVGILSKVTGTGHGLILALSDATSQTWNTINGWASASYAGTTLKVLPDAAALGTNLTSYTTLGETTVSNWAVAQKSDYETIFTNLGSTRNSGGMTYDNNVNAYITTGVGGTAMSGTYWSATQDDDSDAWYFQAGSWYNEYKTDTWYVRPVLGF